MLITARFIPRDMYPFPNRFKWLIADRQLHLAEGAGPAAAQDTLLMERLNALRRWARIRGILTTLLSLGIIASVSTYVTSVVDGLSLASEALRTAAAIAGAFTGVLTLAFLLVTRALGQLEADAIALMFTRNCAIQE